MKFSRIRYLLYILLILSVACSDEKALPEAPDTPEEPVQQIFRQPLLYNTLRTEEKIDSDAQTVTARQTFCCTDGLLTQMLYEQSLTVVEPVTITHTSDITYQEDKVIISDSFGNTQTYQLNEHGFAVSCTLEENGKAKRYYRFNYNNFHLSHIEEYLAEDNFTTPYASIVITPENVGELQIIQKVADTSFSFTAKPNNLSPQNTLSIPCPFLVELHPLSIHTAAIYAQILGFALPTFFQQIIPDGSTNQTTYNYNFDEAGIPTDCFVQTISNGETFNRKISYQID